METQCSIGNLTEDECHKCVYGVVSKLIAPISSYSENDQFLFFSRVGSEITTVCKYHENKFLVKYSHLFGRECCDPLQLHKKRILKGLRKITVDHLSHEKNTNNISLIPGESLCSTCYTKIFVLKKQETTVDLNDTDFVEPLEVLNKIDSACSILGLSPACKIRKLSSDKRVTALQKKVDTLHTTVRKNLELSFNLDISNPSNSKEASSVTHEEYDELLKKLKEKCKLSDKETKVKILSLVPESWSREKVSTEFNVSERLVRVTREITKQQGILPELHKRKGKTIDPQTLESVKLFFEDDEYSRLMPGKKDCVTFKENGIKVQKQKRLVLCNLNELYLEFKNKYPDMKIGRSKFCELRPKWCVIAGGSGTHSVCVCLYHQNVKLMIQGANLKVDYKDLLDIIVCDINSYQCMTGDCGSCPGQEAFSEMFLESEEGDTMPDNITFKQWITSERTELVTVIKSRDEFFELLIEKLIALKKHHYVSKIQTKFLKERKESLTEEEIIILSDFAENYTFIAQDEAQGHHWVNRQATIHPFVYYLKKDNKVKSQCFCVISDTLNHNTATVHCFQQQLVKQIKENHPHIKKVIYFSDGAASQYKNKKNFINLSHHITDFDLIAEWHFFASCHGKNACDGVGGTTKREVTKASLQRPYSNQILTPLEMFEFCKQHIKGITFTYITDEEITHHHKSKLLDRFENCLKITGTRSFHCFIPVPDSSLIKCFVTSQTAEHEIHATTKAVQITLHTRDYVACVYDDQWWLAEVNDISDQNKDVLVTFFHPAGPTTAFKKNEKDNAWVPMDKILRKLSALELTTTTGRTYNIAPKLNEEISQLLNKHTSK